MDRHRLVPLWLLSAVFAISGCHSTTCVTRVLSSSVSHHAPGTPVAMNVTGGFVDHGLYPCSETHEVLVGVNEKAGTVIVNPVHVRAKTGDCINWKVVPSETTITRIKFMDTDEEAAAAGKERSTHPIGRLICTGALRECGVYVALDSGHYVYRLDVQHRGTPMTGDPEIEVSCSCP